MRSFVKIKSSQKGEITLPTTDIGESYHSRENFQSKVCLLTLFVKLKFSRKFPDLQYIHHRKGSLKHLHQEMGINYF